MMCICSANVPTNIAGFRGFDSSQFLISRGGVPRPIGNFPESSSQAMLGGIMLVGGLGVTVAGILLPDLCGKAELWISLSLYIYVYV